MNDCCNKAQDGTTPKNVVVVTGQVIDDATKPNAEEAANLMTDKCKADEGSHILRAEYLYYDTGSQRYSSEPQHT